MSYHDQSPKAPDRFSKFSPEACDCLSCIDEEVPCFQDCDDDSEACQGCREAYEALKNTLSDIQNAKGCY